MTVKASEVWKVIRGWGWTDRRPSGRGFETAEKASIEDLENHPGEY